VRSNRLLKFINSIIGLVALAAALAVWWFGWRPLPQTSGTMGAPVSAAVTVHRDEHGLPRIEAATLEDLLFAQGYVAAQDRLWQMESLRRAANGTLSEVVGAAALEADRETRSHRMARIAERQVAALSPGDYTALAAFARGVNHYIRQQRGNYPVEFRLLGFDPRPWRIEDTLGIGLLMFRTLSSTARIEMQKALLLQKGDKEKLNYLFATRGGEDVQPGSNAWALAPSRTASGKALLANDPHLQHGIPGIWYPVQLRGGGLDVTGVTIPGVPGVVIGRNARIAWGITNLAFDVQDYFLEQLDPATGRYLYRGQIQQAELDRELIPVKGQAPVEFKQWVTVHGPVTAVIGNRQAALQWTAAANEPFVFAILPLNGAQNWTEFRAALASFPAAPSNVVYADVDGNIGLQAMGRLPIRRKHAGDVPVEGSTGEFDWEGYIPFAELPSFYNPPSGRVLTANQNPFPADYPYTVSGNFTAPYRARQIADRIAAEPKWSAASTIQLQADVYSGLSHHLAQHVVKAWQRKQANNPNLAPAVELLREWNGQMMPELPAPLIITYTYQHLRRMISEKAAGQPGADYDIQIGSAHIEALLDRQTPGWFGDWDAVLLRALQEGVEEGQRAQGTDLRKWRYGVYNQLTVRHPVLDRLPWIGRYFNLGPYQANGSTTTIKQTSARMLPSMRFVVDFGDPAGGLYHLPAGVSGHPFSGHYKDQWRAYQSAEGFPLHAAPAATLTLQPAP
jgi:penicillin amidase